jgi:hypothetical protein
LLEQRAMALGLQDVRIAQPRHHECHQRVDQIPARKPRNGAGPIGLRDDGLRFIQMPAGDAIKIWRGERSFDRSVEAYTRWQAGQLGHRPHPVPVKVCITSVANCDELPFAPQQHFLGFDAFDRPPAIEHGALEVFLASDQKVGMISAPHTFDGQ